MTLAMKQQAIAALRKQIRTLQKMIWHLENEKE